MTWQSKLNPSELDELKRAEKSRDDKRQAYNATRSKLKARADARIRRERDRGNDRADEA